MDRSGETISSDARTSGHERGKQHRRAALLAAARVSLAEGRFSMRRVAQLAGVADVTPYNLFGSKIGLLSLLYRELVAESEARLPAAGAADPLCRILKAIDHFGEALAQQPDLYRGLFSARISSRGGRISPRGFDEGIDLWRRLLADMIAAGQLAAGPSTTLVHRHFIHLLGGSVQDWLEHMIDADLWCAQVAHGFALLALPLAAGPAGVALRDVLETSADRLAAHRPAPPGLAVSPGRAGR